MTRHLTEEEQISIVEFWEKNENMTEDQVIEHFEKVFGMPVTRTAVRMAVINYGD